MRLPWTVLVGSVLFSAGSNATAAHPAGSQITAVPEYQLLEKRQVASGILATGPGGPIDTTDSSDSGSSDSNSNTSSTSMPTSDSTSASTTSSAGDSTSSTQAADSTITRTVTVGGDVSTRLVTAFTTVQTTVTTTSTVFSTLKTTISNQDTATTTVFVTRTRTVNAKREVAGPTDDANAAALWVEARATQEGLGFIGFEAGLKERAGLEKRATVTDLVTVTGDGSAVVSTVRRTDMQTSTVSTRSTHVLTETIFLNAKTTVTTTSTVDVTSTRFTTASSSSETSNADSASGSSGGSSGLSTGAKAGIGAGVGVAGLAVIAAALFFFFRRKRSPEPTGEEYMGQSEVPIAGGGSNSQPPMAAAPISRYGNNLPSNSMKASNLSAEGYRGTAMGDGRAGYAKPQPYGAAYTRTGNVSPNEGGLGASRTTRSAHSERTSTFKSGDEALMNGSQGSPDLHSAELGDGIHQGERHDEVPTDVNELDGHGVNRRPSGNVYEMPTTNY